MSLLVQSLQKTVRECVELEQVNVTFRLKIKSWDQFQNKHGVELNEVFLLLSKSMLGGGGQDYKHIAGVSPKLVQKFN